MEYVSDYFRRGAMREMNDNERQTIIDSLKKQWEDVHYEYQTLSVIIDTIPKRQYKELFSLVILIREIARLNEIV
jgi:hypothetical protein